MATYYWVGGSGNWDATTTTNWSASSGGASGASAPTSADDVIFDANSNTGTNAFTVTVTGDSTTPALCRDFSTGGAGGALDGNMTLAFGTTGVLDCYGSLTFPATNFSVTSTSGTINFQATTTGKTITTNGISIGNTTFIFLGSGGEWTLGSALTGTGAISFRNGALNTNNFNITLNSIGSGNVTNTRTLTLGSSSITLSGTTPVNMVSVTGLTFNAGTSTISCSAATPTFVGGGLTYYNVSFTSTASGSLGAHTITGTNTFNNLSFASRITDGTLRRISIGDNQTVNGTLTLGTANSAIRRMQIGSSVTGVARTITVNGTVATLSDVDFRDITAAGTVATPWTGTRLGNAGGNSNITFDAGKNVYRVGTAGNWATVRWATLSGGTANVNNFPLPQDTMIFDTNTPTGTHSIDNHWWLGTLDCSLLNVAVTIDSLANSPTFHGNVTLDADVTLAGTVAWQFAGAPNQTLTSAGRTFTQPLTINKPTTTSLILGDSVTSNLATTLTQGTLDLNTDKVLTCTTFSSSNTNTRSIAFGTSGNITLTGNATTIMGMGTATNFTYTGTPTVNCTYSGSTGTRVVNFGATSGGTESNALNINFTAGTDIADVYSRIKNLNFNGFKGTFAAGSRIIYGNLTFDSGMTISATTSTTTLTTTSGTQEITSNGKTLDFPIIQDGVGGTVKLIDNMTLGSTRAYTLTNGTLNVDGKTLSTGSFSSSNSNARTLNLGTNGKITVTGSGATAWDTGTSTNLTELGTGTIDMTSSSAKTFAGGSAVFPYTLNQGGTGTLTISGSNTFENMTNTVQPTTITFTAGTTTSVKDFAVSGIPGSLVTLNSSTPGTQWNLAKV